MSESKTTKFVKKNLLVIMLLLLLGFFGMTAKNFLSVGNAISILRQVAIYGVMSCGIVFVLVGGNFDLTAGSVVSLVCVVMIRLHDIVGPIPAMLTAICVGVTCGAITGFIVGYSRLNSMIAGLGLQSIYYGCALIYTNGKFFNVKDVNATWFSFLGRGYMLGIPTQVWVYLVMMVIFQFILTKTVFGKQVFAVGGNAKASNFSGINDRAIIMKTYMMSGFCVAIAGILLSSRAMAAQSNVGEGYEFEVITACILSGTSLLGGEGSITRALWGILIMGVLKTGYVMLSVPYYIQWLTQCIIIVTIVGLDVASRKRVTE